MSSAPRSHRRPDHTDPHLTPKEPAMPTYDDLDFEARDEIDAEIDAAYAHLREAITGLPFRP